MKVKIKIKNQKPDIFAHWCKLGLNSKQRALMFDQVYNKVIKLP